MNKIGFVELYEIAERYYPVPTSTILPEWYKKTNPYMSKIRHPENMTVKRCLPVFDAMTNGYTLLLHADILVSFEYENGQKVQVTSWSPQINYPFVQSHAFVQFQNYPGMESGVAAKKYVNPFGIVTPPGYSCLFTQPMHQEESPIKILEGIVDTDKQHLVNFPFIYKNPNFEGVILAGTPIVQIVPFKRESWKLEINNKKDTNKIKKNQRELGANIFGQYRDFSWNRKEYK